MLPSVGEGHLCLGPSLFERKPIRQGSVSCRQLRERVAGRSQCKAASNRHRAGMSLGSLLHQRCEQVKRQDLTNHLPMFIHIHVVILCNRV